MLIRCRCFSCKSNTNLDLNLAWLSSPVAGSPVAPSEVLRNIQIQMENMRQFNGWAYEVTLTRAASKF